MFVASPSNILKLPTLKATVSAVALAALASCGGSGPGASPSPVPVPTTTPTPTPVPTPVPVTTPTPTPTPIPPSAINPTPGPTPPAPTPPAPAPTPTPAPTPLPAPPPGTNFNTAEYRQSNGVVSASAITAYNAGASGNGITIGIVDSGIDLNSPEFSGGQTGNRIHAASRDVVSGRTLQDENGHGTFVAAVAAAQKNDLGVHGIAFNSRLLIARTDSGCPSPTTGCNHNDDDIAAGVDLAIANGARIINISLGGSPANTRLTRSIFNATAQGIIIVFSAGNEFDSDDAAVRAAAVNPDSFPRTLMQATGSARGLIIAAGAINPDTNLITSFSNRAGDQAEFFIAAPGQGIITRGLNGNLVTVNGTSFAAPHVAGAFALLLEAFPNLTGPQAVDLLLRSARDAGTPGVDSIYGRGILDIGRAFTPQGGASVATVTGQTGTAVALGGGVQAVTTRLNLAQKLRASSDTLISSVRRSGRTELSFNAEGARRYIYEEGKPAASRLQPATQDARALGHMQLNDDLALGFAQGYGVDILASAPGAKNTALYLATPDGLNRTPGAGAMLAWQQGPWLMRFATGSARARSFDGQNRADVQLMSAIIGADRTFGGLQLNAAITLENERGAVLGATAQDGLGLGRGSQSLRSALGLGYDFGRGWRLLGAAEIGRTRLDGRGNALVDSVGGLLTTEWHVALEKSGLLGRDSLGLRLSQPLRVDGGTATLAVPTSFSYASLTAQNSLRSVSLVPDARELDVELAYRWNTGSVGDVQLNLFGRMNPGHQRRVKEDIGAALQWQWRF